MAEGLFHVIIYARGDFKMSNNDKRGYWGVGCLELPGRSVMSIAYSQFGCPECSDGFEPEPDFCIRHDDQELILDLYEVKEQTGMGPKELLAKIRKLEMGERHE